MQNRLGSDGSEADRFSALPSSPFVRLRALLDDVTPQQAPVSLAIGEPRHAPPPAVMDSATNNPPTITPSSSAPSAAKPFACPAISVMTK